MPSLNPLRTQLEKNLIVQSPAVWETTAWALGLIKMRGVEENLQTYIPSQQSLNILTSNWLKNVPSKIHSISPFTLSAMLIFKRGDWRPILSKKDIDFIESCIEGVIDLDDEDEVNEMERIKNSAALLAYHHGNIYPDKKIIPILKEGIIVRSNNIEVNDIFGI